MFYLCREKNKTLFWANKTLFYPLRKRNANRNIKKTASSRNFWICREYAFCLRIWSRLYMRMRRLVQDGLYCESLWNPAKFWLGNVLRATTARTFSTSQLPEVLRTQGALRFWPPNLFRATTACNFWFLISRDGPAPAALASLLVDPLEPQNIWKKQCYTMLYLFDHLDLLSSAFLLSDLLSSSFLFSDSSHLCFFSCLVAQALCVGTWEVVSTRAECRRCEGSSAKLKHPLPHPAASCAEAASWCGRK